MKQARTERIHRYMGRTKNRRILLIIAFPILVILFALFIIPQTEQNTEKKIPNNIYTNHILGGFSLDSPDRAVKAAAEGVQVAFQYGQPPSPGNQLGQTLQSLQIKVVDGFISSYLSYYECHRSKIVKHISTPRGEICQTDRHPGMTEEVLLAAVAAHLKQVRSNPLIIGYWVLDDWVSWDAGSARQILIKIHQLIQHYTPGRPAICGFGGYVWLDHAYGWDNWLADNFSPQGCDMVGLYVYAPTIANSTQLASPAIFNWSMQGLLPVIFASLQRRGWDINQEPFIGIVQAYGGPIANSDRHWITPSAQDIETESRSFCEHGAAGITFYGWDNSSFGPTTQTPMNSTQIQTGIQRGIAACKAYWSGHP